MFVVLWLTSSIVLHLSLLNIPIALVLSTEPSVCPHGYFGPPSCQRECNEAMMCNAMMSYDVLLVILFHSVLHDAKQCKQCNAMLLYGVKCTTQCCAVLSFYTALLAFQLFLRRCSVCSTAPDPLSGGMFTWEYTGPLIKPRHVRVNRFTQGQRLRACDAFGRLRFSELMSSSSWGWKTQYQREFNINVAA